MRHLVVLMMCHAHGVTEGGNVPQSMTGSLEMVSTV